jgi:hypothetical protein
MRKTLLSILAGSLIAIPSCSQLNKSDEPLDDYRKFIMAYNAVCSIPYKADSIDIDHWQTPEETMKLYSGDCEDLAIYFQHIANGIHLNSRIIIGKKDTRPYNTRPLSGDLILNTAQVWREYTTNIPDHAWNEVTIDKKVYVVDIIFKVNQLKSEIPPDKYVESIDFPSINEKLEKIAK